MQHSDIADFIDPLEEIQEDIVEIESEIAEMLRHVVGPTFAFKR